MHKLFLASQSPRRKDLLSSKGYKFIQLHVEVSEIIEESVNFPDLVMKIAEKKAKAAVSTYKYLKSKGNLVLSADTLVFLGDEILGKPKSSIESKEVLSKLSGNKHSVITGLCLYETYTNMLKLDFCRTEVWFKKLSSLQIDEYVQSGEPNGKSGSYAIQGQGEKFVKKIHGPVDNVIGLPLSLLGEMLKEKEWQIEREAT